MAERLENKHIFHRCMNSENKRDCMASMTYQTRKQINYTVINIIN